MLDPPTALVGGLRAAYPGLMRVTLARARVLPFLFTFLVSLHHAAGQEQTPLGMAAVTPVEGPSWLRTLSISVDETRLGRVGADGQPPESAAAPSPFARAVRRALELAGSNDEEARKTLETRFTFDGADLYRLDCRSCHGPRGAGEPPEVNSLVGPSRALSPALLEQNMRAAGRPVRADLAKQLSAEAERIVRERMRDGGKRMPSFQYLSDGEVDALTDYLKRLAGAPGALRRRNVTESVARIGEHLVQGTCRICHDASGPGGGHMMMMMGRIPALASIPDQLSFEAVVHKVRYGWSGMAGMMHRMSRMPTFPYVSDDEVAAAYLYLAYYPP
jgi:mono/diheme cytochrome c family protein